MKQYRKRFVFISMSLISFVLLTVFIVLEITAYYHHCSELRSTMSHVLQPISGRLGIDDAGPPAVPGDTPPAAPDAPMGPANSKAQAQRLFRGGNSQIITVLVKNDSNEHIIVSREDSEISDSEIQAAIPDALAADKSFGTLPDHNLIFYKEADANCMKIALTQTSYITQRVWRSIATYGLIFLLSFAVFLFVTVRLSKFASRPMERAMQLERRFVADVSHDLKTPITVILANNSILKSNANAAVATQMQWVDSTEAAAKNMMHLIDEMLTLSSLDERAARTPGSGMDAVSLSSAAEKAELQMESIAYDRKITLNAEIRDGLFVRATADDLDRICSGLLENALKYEPAGGEVTMTLEANKKKAVLSIRNRSSVIAEEEQPHIFERFYRGDKARDTKQGHGLGLPIIKQITDLIGAAVSVRSTEMDGTTFRVEFDLAPPPDKSH